MNAVPAAAGAGRRTLFALALASAVVLASLPAAAATASASSNEREPEPVVEVAVGGDGGVGREGTKSRRRSSPAAVTPCNLTATTSRRLSAARAAAYTAPDSVQCDDDAVVRGRRFATGASLAYLTPWNGGGYAAAKRYVGKFTHLAPVWLQVRDSGAAGSGAVELAGLQDVHTQWMADVDAACRAPGSHPVTCPRIVPRVVWEASHAGSGARAAAIAALMRAAKEHGFDGYVLEVGGGEAPAMAAFVRETAAAVAGLPATARGAAAGDAVRTVILVLPPLPAGAPGPQHARMARAVADFARAGVSYFSVMTYDFSAHAGRPGPNAPLPWTVDTLTAMLASTAAGSAERATLAAKLLLGIPFYGYDNGDAIVGSQWRERLVEYTPQLRIDSRASEHYFEYTARDNQRTHTVYYPTPWMVAERLAAAARLGVGVAVWEIGQGPAWLFDVL